MITTFKTGGITSPSSSTVSTGKSGNKIIGVLIVAGLAFLGWRYIIKPELDKRKNDQNGNK